MNKAFSRICVLLFLVLVGCGTDSAASTVTIPSVEELRSQSDGVVVEVGYLDHQPMRGVLAEVDGVLASYGDKINAVRYNLDTPEGEAFIKARQITGHTPIAIFINGETEFQLPDRAIKFYSFPGSEWRVDDLRTVIDQEIAKP